MVSIEQIRNVSIISHVDHGKTTLSDYLLGIGGKVPKKLMGELRALDDMEEEQSRGITIETSLASLNLTYNDEPVEINLIDTPGHVDFSGKVAEALRLVDGSIVLVDSVEGVMAQTQTVLRQAMAEHIIPILLINKIDRLIIELELPLEQIQSRIQRIVFQVNQILKDHEFPGMVKPNFNKGSIILASAIDGWGINHKITETSTKNIKDVKELYLAGKKDELKELFPLGEVLVQSIFDNLPNPLAALKLKFPDLLLEETPDATRDEFTKVMHTASEKGETVLLSGKIAKVGKSQRFGALVRVSSGTVSKGMKLYSNATQKVIKVVQIVKMVGNQTFSIDSTAFGEVVALITSPQLHPGDVITEKRYKDLALKNISYVQEPVVAMHIEPKRIKDVNKLPELLESITESTPGLIFEMNKDTGQLTVIGVGTLQLDILKKELTKAGLEIEVTPPIVLKFEIPTTSAEFIAALWDSFSVKAGNSNQWKDSSNDEILYTDTHQNQLLLGTTFTINSEAILGMVQSFKQCVRASPITNEYIKNLTVRIEELNDQNPLKTYEEGMILMLGVVRQALEQTHAKIHLPYYHLTISVPEDYVGNLIQELQKRSAQIIDISVKGKLQTISCIMKFEEALDSADAFRHATDGNAFWSFNNIEFLPEFI